MFKRNAALTIAVVITLLLGFQVNAQNLLINAGFEEDPKEAGAMLKGWGELFGKAAVWGENIKVVQEESGERRLAIFDASAEQSMGLRSDRLPVTAGNIYEATAMVKGTAGQTAGLYIEFWNAAGERIANKFVKGDLGEAWQQVKISALAPADATEVTVLVYSYIGNVCDVFFDDLQLVEF